MNENNKLGLPSGCFFELEGAAKWAKFLSILGFVGVGLLVLLALFGGNLMASLAPSPAAATGIAFTFSYLIAAAICFVIYFFLYKFAAGIQKSIANGETSSLEEGLTSLRRYFKIQGIITIVSFALMILSFLVMMAVGRSAMM